MKINGECLNYKNSNILGANFFLISHRDKPNGDDRVAEFLLVEKINQVDEREEHERWY